MLTGDKQYDLDSLLHFKGFYLTHVPIFNRQWLLECNLVEIILGQTSALVLGQTRQAMNV